MTEREYLKKVMVICNECEPIGCKECPLFKHGCGVPRAEEEISAMIKAVKEYTPNENNGQKCKHCGCALPEELRDDPDANYCPRCGGKLEEVSNA